MPRDCNSKRSKRHYLRDSRTGQFAPSKDSPLIRWNSPGALGFAYWVKDNQARIINSRNIFEPWKPTRNQADYLKICLKVDSNGHFVHTMSLLIGPRRIGKTIVHALIALWLTCSRTNHSTFLLGTTHDHTQRTMLSLLKRIIENTVALRRQFHPLEKNLTAYAINHPKMKSTIQMSSGVSTATSFGSKLNLVWASDLHASPDLQPFFALQASLLDSADSLCLIDSNPDHLSGPVHSLQNEAGVDPQIHCTHVWFKDINEYCEKAPEWISRERARRLERTTLEADFRRDVLGQRSDIVNSLFPEAVIEICRDSYSHPVDDTKALIGNRAFVIGGGLDRADSEWGSVFGNDNSVFTTVAKIASLDNQEPEIFVLDQHLFRPSTGRAIKRHILKMHQRYGFTNVTLEAHNVSDIQPWLVEQGIPTETVNPHSTTQNIAWPELVRIAKTGRLRISNNLSDLFREMAGMTAVYSLRREVLQAFELPNVQCLNKSSRRHLCFIFGGSLELLCGEHCEAYQGVVEMFKQYTAYQTESTLMLAEFYRQFVKVKGAVIYQAA